MAGRQPSPKYYGLAEERVNVASHALGALLSLVGLGVLLQRALAHGDGWHLASYLVYGLCMVALFAASTACHTARPRPLRQRLRTVDHAAIYLLIAGTYTPFALITLRDSVGWTVFAITWTMAVAGIVIKLFFTGRFQLLSTLVYVFMGWLIVFFINPLIERLPAPGLAWLLAGGIAYTLGALADSLHRIPYGHAVFHVLEVVGAACQFVAVLLYTLPAA